MRGINVIVIVIIIITMGGGPATRGPRPTANFFTMRLKVEKTFTNHNFREGLHVTFDLNKQ